MPVSLIQIVLNSEIRLPKMLFGIEVCSVQLMCETLQPAWQQMVELFWSQTKQTSQMNTFKPLQAFFLLVLDYFTLRNCWEWIAFLLLSPVSTAASLTLAACFFVTVTICWDKEPSVVQLWSDSSSCGPAALSGFGHFGNVLVRLPEVKGTQRHQK